MPKRVVMVVLIALLLMFQWQLWFGRGGLRSNEQVSSKLEGMKSKGKRLEQENTQLKAEVENLKDPTGNLEMVEEKARAELGMIKPGEIYVQFTK